MPAKSSLTPFRAAQTLRLKNALLLEKAQLFGAFDHRPAQ
jgi:hypothetical protein